MGVQVNVNLSSSFDKTQTKVKHFKKAQNVYNF